MLEGRGIRTPGWCLHLPEEKVDRNDQHEDDEDRQHVIPNDHDALLADEPTADVPA